MQLTTAQFEAMTDSELLQALYRWDALRSDDSDIDPNIIEHNANGASQELEARCGEGADERLADYTTASHATHHEMVNAALDYPQTLMDIARGTHDANCIPGRCPCGRRV